NIDPAERQDFVPAHAGESCHRDDRIQAVTPEPLDERAELILIENDFVVASLPRRLLGIGNRVAREKLLFDRTREAGFQDDMEQPRCVGTEGQPGVELVDVVARYLL